MLVRFSSPRHSVVDRYNPWRINLSFSYVRLCGKFEKRYELIFTFVFNEIKHFDNLLTGPDSNTRVWRKVLEPHGLFQDC